MEIVSGFSTKQKNNFITQYHFCIIICEIVHIYNSTVKCIYLIRKTFFFSKIYLALPLQNIFSILFSLPALAGICFNINP